MDGQAMSASVCEAWWLASQVTYRFQATRASGERAWFASMADAQVWSAA